MDVPEIITLVGIILTLVVSVVTLFFTLRDNRKTAFINSITASRISYISELRTTIAELCALVTSYKSRIAKLDYAEHFELVKQTNKLKYLIRLYLNPSDKYWDNQVLALTDQIVVKDNVDPQNKIDELVVITQYLLKLEWEGVKLESEKGILSVEEKKKLYDEFVALHQAALNKK